MKMTVPIWYNIKIEGTDEEIATESGLMLVGKMIHSMKLKKYLQTSKIKPQISDEYIIKTYAGLLSQGKTEYADIKLKENIASEKRTVTKMINLFCKKNHHIITGLCDSCTKLLKYSYSRLDKCTFGEKKPVCSECFIHCFSADMRENMREVMRFSGPRMLFYHPFSAIKHLIKKISSKSKKKIK